MTVKAYAKLNLILNVLGKRADGFHEVETLMHAIDLCDLVSIMPAAAGNETDIQIIGCDNIDCKDISPKDNLAYKALQLLKEEYKAVGIEESFNITIEKHIPIAAGLGGGSADAAAILTAVSDMYNIPKDARLYGLAAKLGSDVPFCLAAQNGKPCAIGRGRGELLEFTQPIDARISLKVSDIKIPNKTASVYKALKPEDFLVKYNIEQFLNADTIEEKKKYMGNTLKRPLERITGKHEAWFLCGAGPTYFMIGESGEYGLCRADCK